MRGLNVTRGFWLPILLSMITATPVHGKAAETWWFGAPSSRVPAALKMLKSTHGVYPETLVWSHGGSASQGLKLVIESDRPSHAYLAGDVVALRVGVMNCGTETVGLSCDRGFLQPPINMLRVDAPERAQAPRGFLYMGRDVVELHPKKASLVSVPPGAVFNPSQDSCYYRSGFILQLRTPGTYRFWSTITYDGGCSSIESRTFMLVSDTLDVTVRARRKFLGLF
jgi:hypothetical protein